MNFAIYDSSSWIAASGHFVRLRRLLARQKAGCAQSGKRLASRPVKLRARLRPAVNSRSNWNGPKLRTALL